MELLKLLNVGEVAAQIISFLLLFFLLRLFAWKPLLKLLDERREKIAYGLKAVEDGKKDIEKLKLEYQVRLDAATGEAQLKIKDAIEESRKLSEELNKSAHQEAQKILEKARSDIKYELSKAKDQLKAQIVELSISAAEAVIEDKLTEEEDKKIVESFLDKIDTV